MIGRRELRAVRLAGGGHKLADDFYRPIRRTRPGENRAPVLSRQLELFAGKTAADSRAICPILFGAHLGRASGE